MCNQADEDYAPCTQEQIDPIVRTMILTGEMEGCWIAVCECGQDCGFALLEPNDDDKRYVACPRPDCDGKGTNGNGKVRWIKRN